jgi:hypothetical protein
MPRVQFPNDATIQELSKSLTMDFEDNDISNPSLLLQMAMYGVRQWSSITEFIACSVGFGNSREKTISKTRFTSTLFHVSSQYITDDNSTCICDFTMTIYLSGAFCFSFVIRDRSNDFNPRAMDGLVHCEYLKYLASGQTLTREAEEANSSVFESYLEYAFSIDFPSSWYSGTISFDLDNHKVIDSTIVLVTDIVHDNDFNAVVEDFENGNYSSHRNIQ